MPARGISREGRVADFSPVSQLKKPPEDVFAATALEAANLVAPRLPTRPYPSSFVTKDDTLPISKASM